MAGKRPFWCKANHSNPLLYTQIALTTAFTVTGVALMCAKQWKLAHVFITFGVFTGIFATTVLQARLSTDSCHDKTFQILYGICLMFTLVAFLSWGLLVVNVFKIINLGTNKR